MFCLFQGKRCLQLFNVVLGLHFKQKKVDQASEATEVEATDLSRFVNFEIYVTYVNILLYMYLYESNRNIWYGLKNDLAEKNVAGWYVCSTRIILSRRRNRLCVFPENIHTLPQRVFWFEPLHPSGNSILPSYFSLKKFGFGTLNPCGILNEPPWGCYGYFLEPHIIATCDSINQQYHKTYMKLSVQPLQFL